MENTFELLIGTNSPVDESLEIVLSKFAGLLAMSNPDVTINILVKKTFYAVLPDETVVEINESMLCFWTKQGGAVAYVPAMIYKGTPACEEAPLLQEVIPSGLLVETGGEEINQKFVSEVNEVIESYLIQAQSPTIGILSKKMNMSPTKFRIEMKKNTGKSPIKYIHACKMEKAKEYIALRNYKFTEVAYMLGFSDSRYFRKQFKKYFNQSPTEFLKSLKD